MHTVLLELKWDINRRLPLILLQAITNIWLLPFGLTNALSVFQNLVNYVLQVMLNVFVSVYASNKTSHYKLS